MICLMAASLEALPVALVLPQYSIRRVHFRFGVVARKVSNGIIAAIAQFLLVKQVGLHVVATR